MIVILLVLARLSTGTALDSSKSWFWRDLPNVENKGQATEIVGEGVQPHYFQNMEFRVRRGRGGGGGGSGGNFPFFF